MPHLTRIMFEPIKTIEQGKAFIEELVRCNMDWHFEDSPHDILWADGQELSMADANVLQRRCDELYRIEDWGVFDCPIGYCLAIHPVYQLDMMRAEGMTVH